jgi:hypothetical protein
MLRRSSSSHSTAALIPDRSITAGELIIAFPSLCDDFVKISISIISLISINLLISSIRANKSKSSKLTKLVKML